MKTIIEREELVKILKKIKGPKGILLDEIAMEFLKCRIVGAPPSSLQSLRVAMECLNTGIHCKIGKKGKKLRFCWPKKKLDELFLSFNS